VRAPAAGSTSRSAVSAAASDGTRSAPCAVTTCRRRASASAGRRDAGQHRKGIECHAREGRDADALRDESLDRDVVVGLEADARGETRPFAEFEEVPRQRGHPAIHVSSDRSATPSDGRMCGGQDEHEVVATRAAYRESAGAVAMRIVAVTRVAERQGDVGAVFADRLTASGGSASGR
jgi:hypothetical protein